VTLLVLVTSAFAVEPIRDAALLVGVGEARLDVTAPYLSIAPVSAILDTLTLLTVAQHVALLVWAIVVFAAWRLFRKRSKPVQPVREAIAAGIFLVVVVAIYAIGAMAPRPMARIALSDETVLAVDFHAHTKYSHDGRPDWTPEDVRAWHRDAGFEVAYVTDHRTFEGARDAWANNPTFAGQGTTLLPGIEVVWKGEHVLVLDADRKYRGILTETLRDIDEPALAMASSIPGNEPLLIETFPGNIKQMIPAAGPGTAGVRAIELVDGAPKGLGQTRRERATIVHYADSLNLALVAGSNHHGWGHTASGWTLLYVPGWRNATPDQLGDAIVNILRRGGVGSTRVVERYVADTESGIKLVLTAPLITWGMLRTLSPDERAAWVAWAVALTLVARLLASRRPRPDAGR